MKSRDGSSLINEADGTTLWPLLSKKLSQRRLISAVCTCYFAAGLLGEDFFVAVLGLVDLAAGVFRVADFRAVGFEPDFAFEDEGRAVPVSSVVRS